jgi:PKD repeat protein
LADTGTYPIQLIASDGNGGYDTLEWTIFIVPPPASNHSHAISPADIANSLSSIE